MRKIIKFLKFHFSIDRLFLCLFAALLFVMSFFWAHPFVAIITIGSVLVVILLLRFALFTKNNSKNRDISSEIPQAQQTKEIITKLTSQMNVELNPSEPFVFVPDLANAKVRPSPFWSKFKIHYGGKIYIGYLFVLGLDNIALQGVVAHELAHLKKKHALKFLVVPFIFIAILAYLILSSQINVIILFLILAVWALTFSIISWYDEYQADAEASSVVGEKEMIHTLDKIATLINRRRDTFTHPSFNKRTSHIKSNGNTST
jgi:hypothetical protein